MTRVHAYGSEKREIFKSVSKKLKRSCACVFSSTVCLELIHTCCEESGDMAQRTARVLISRPKSRPYSFHFGTDFFSKNFIKGAIFIFRPHNFLCRGGKLSCVAFCFEILPNLHDLHPLQIVAILVTYGSVGSAPDYQAE